ncbi:hypothetical protein YB2330_002899 [Saitoella coloradoensis]
MAGRRLADLVGLATAITGIAQKHIALRSQQAALLTRTSSLIKPIKNAAYSERSATARPAAATAPAMNEELRPASRQPAPPHAGSDTTTQGTSIAADKADAALHQGIDDEVFYAASKAHSVDGPAPKHALNVKQREHGVLGEEFYGLKAPEEDRGSEAKVDREMFASPRDPKHVGESQKDILESSKGGLRVDQSTRAAGEAQFTAPTSTAEPKEQLTKTSPEEALESLEQERGEASELDIKAADSDLSAHDPAGAAATSSTATSIPSHAAGPSAEGGSLAEGIDQDVYYTSKAEQQQQEDVREGEAKMPVRPGQPGDGNSKLTKDIDSDVYYTTKSTGAPPTTSVAEEQRQAAEDTDTKELAASIQADLAVGAEQIIKEVAPEPVKRQLNASRIPSSRIGRLFHYGTLAASMSLGALSEGTKRILTGGGKDAGTSVMLSQANMDRLVSKLTRMRGAALKLGQVISFQDAKVLPGPVREVLRRVQDAADYMPAEQLEEVMATNLGREWRDMFESFEEVPIAAASIGQVHSAVLKNGMKVAVKVQYPGVADSISSDLNNLGLLLTASRLLPKGLFLDKTIASARTELGWECDYVREAACANKFGELLKDDPVFRVPKIVDDASGKGVLTMEMMPGTALGRKERYDQETRNWIATQVLKLCLREIVEWRYMQTDPNWSNFLYDEKMKTISLLDFGASRAFPDKFIDLYTQTLLAASRGDREACRTLSIELGYLTGMETNAMTTAHVDSILTLGEPFANSAPDTYDFSQQTITDRVKGLISVMIHQRLSPPPVETYSLHRKLSGAFLLCAELDAKIECKKIFKEVMGAVGK